MLTLYRLIDFVFWLLNLALLLRVLLSWFSPGSGNVLTYWVYRITEPILAPLRRVIPPFAGMDFSPMVALLLLELVHRLVIGLVF
jgi:YggT family protein